MQRRHRQAVAERGGRRTDLGQVLWHGGDTHFRQFERDALVELHARQEGTEIVLAHGLHDFDRADIGRVFVDFREAENAVLAVEVVDGEAAEAHAITRIELVGQLHRATIQRPGKGHGLEGGARLEDTGGDAVERVLDQRSRRLIGVEIGHRSQGDDFAGIDINHHAGGGDGLVAGHRIDQLVVHDVLHPHVDAELDRGQRIAARQPQLLQQRHRFGVHAPLDAGNALIVDIGRTQNMGGLVHAGIEALGFGDEVDAGNAQPHHLFLDRGRQLALHPHEALVAGEAIAQPFFVQIRQDGAQLLHRLLHVDDAARLGIERGHADIDGHFQPIAVENRRLAWMASRVCPSMVWSGTPMPS